jgi:tetratricopeptide (TPR) repeat protein
MWAGLTLAQPSADVSRLQQRWAEINYLLSGKTQITAFEQLADQANSLVAASPDSPELLIWSGIIKSTYAGARGGLGALKIAKSAKKDLEKALEMDPSALEGSAYTSLGTLYYSVPGWPIGFGDDEKAEQLLQKALTHNPDGIDPNYFYGDFLLKQNRYREARQYLLQAQQAAPRPGREIADQGRQQEIRQRLAELGQQSTD